MIKGIDEELHYSFDYDLWMQLFKVQPNIIWIDSPCPFFESIKQVNL